MDQAQIRERYSEDDFGASASWPMVAEGYQSPHIISPGHEHQNFNFNAAAMPTAPVYVTQPSHLQQQSFHPTWPSMLASSHHPGQVHMAAPTAAQMAPMQPYVPPQPLPPLVTTAPAHPQPPQQPSSRRTLTDQDRRRMCQYHEEHPTVKQTEIGAMFGVERSTVSKVLRQKEKYLAADEGSRSPIRKPKGKFPDIERALSNWALKYQQKGMQLDDEIIRDKARHFAASVGSNEASVKVSSPSWLEKFKQKNQIPVSKQKKGAGTSAGGSSGAKRQGSQTPSGISPISPAGLDPSPLTPSGDRSFDRKTESPATDTSSASRLLHSKSTASLASAFSDGHTAFTTAGAPPLPVAYGQSIKIPQQITDMSRMMPPSTPENQRPRSQTFPMLGIEANHLGIDGGAFMEAQIEEMMAGSAVLKTPQEEYSGRSLSVTSMSSTDMSRFAQAGSVLGTPGIEHSPAIMGPPMGSLHQGSATSSTMASPMGSPTLDEGRRGLEVAMGFLTSLPSGVVDPQEYALLNKLMDKLNGLDPFGGGMPGGMHPIDVKKEMERKRSIQSL